MGFDYKREYIRMIRTYGGTGESCKGIMNCDACPFGDREGKLAMCDPSRADEMVEVVRKWAEENPSDIDWAKVPVNTPVEVKKFLGGEWNTRYFIGQRRDGEFVCFYGEEGLDNATQLTSWKYCRLVEDNPTYHKRES